jgi:hypothetical protein
MRFMVMAAVPRDGAARACLPSFCARLRSAALIGVNERGARRNARLGNRCALLQMCRALRFSVKSDPEGLRRVVLTFGVAS